MLILRRKAGESIVIGDEVKVTVIDINEGSIRLAVEAPKRIPVLRSELLQAADANRDAAIQKAGPQSLLPLLHKDSSQAVRRTPRKERAGSLPAPAPADGASPADNASPADSASPADNASPADSASPANDTSPVDNTSRADGDAKP